MRTRPFPTPPGRIEVRDRHPSRVAWTPKTCLHKERIMDGANSQLQGTPVTTGGVPIESGSKGQQSRSISGARNFLAGGIGGVCGITIGHPLDTIKVT